MAVGRRHLLLVNPSAGAGRAGEARAGIERELAAAGIEYRTVLTEGVEHGVAQALAGAQAGEIPVVVSGDGLIGQVGGALAGSQTPLGIIPGGRGNDLARVLGIPTEPAGAVAILARGESRAIDVGEANGRRFLGIASCGFDSDANRIANEAKLVRGNLVYAYAALRALISWKPAIFTLELDGEAAEATGYTVAVCNSKAYGGGMYAAPDAELDDGVFDIGVTGNVGKLRFLRGVMQLFKGEHLETLAVRMWRANEVKVDADRPFAVYADGDHLTDLPATIRLLPRALQVIAPPVDR